MSPESYMDEYGEECCDQCDRPIDTCECICERCKDSIWECACDE